MVKKVYTIHLAHASLQYTDKDAQTAEDVRYIATVIKPAVCSFTESNGSRTVIKDTAEAHGYRAVVFAGYANECFMYDPDKVKLKSKDTITAYKGLAGVSEKRNLSWIRLNYEGEDIWYHIGHWIVVSNLTDGVVKRHNQMTSQMAAQVRKHAQGKSISFFAGDTNLDDDGGTKKGLNYSRTFRANGLLTIWDEKKVYPSTRDTRTIDIIGSYTPDKEVTGNRYKVWPKQNSDHRFISAWYDITTTQPSAPNGSGGGKSTTAPVPPVIQDDFYATGGTVDWSDYYDDENFYLAQAVDDSDGPTHGDTIT